MATVCSMPGQPPSSTSGPLPRVAFYGLAIGLALIHAFITFRGLTSAEGMEQAQLAREIARGNFFQTKVIRPYGWALLAESGRQPAPLAMPDITQPPLQPLLLAPLFKVLEGQQTFTPGKSSAIYTLDRVIACVGVTGYLLTLLWTHGAARRLFDETVAGVAVLVLVFCEPLWNLAVSGSAVALLMPLFALAFRLWVAIAQAREAGENTARQLIGLGVACALMILAHWMAVWVVLGVLLSLVVCLPGNRGGAVLAAVAPAGVLVAWGIWITMRCGDPLGGAKTIFQSHLLVGDAETLQRQFSLALPTVVLDGLVRKLGVNCLAQLGAVYAHLGHLLPAIVFFPTLLVRFKRGYSNWAKAGLGIMAVTTLAGMCLLGLPEGAEDEAALYPILAPAMTIFGTAMMAMLWARLQGGALTFWAVRGYAVIAVAVSAVPMLVELPTHLKLGLTMAGRMFPNWPPYVPERVAVMSKLVDSKEVVFSDAPWFVAWYADIPAVWLPNKRSDFSAMKEKIESSGARVAGVVVTPVSARVHYLSDAFNGGYREWPDLIFRGPMIAFDKEFVPSPDFPYNVPIPLVAVPVGEKESLSLLMTFYTDRMRSPKE